MCLMLDLFLWGHSSRVCDISCFFVSPTQDLKKNSHKSTNTKILAFLGQDDMLGTVMVAFSHELSILKEIVYVLCIGIN